MIAVELSTRQAELIEVILRRYVESHTSYCGRGTDRIKNRTLLRVADTLKKTLKAERRKALAVERKAQGR